MPWDPEYIDDGETPGAAGFNTLFNTARSAVNALDRDAPRRGALNPDLVPPLFVGDHPVSAFYDGDAASGPLVYDIAVFGASLAYVTHGAPNGSFSVGTLGTGDRSIIGHPSATGGTGHTACQVDIKGGTGLLLGNHGTDRTSLIFAALDVEVNNISGNASPVHAMACIQYKASTSATWFTIFRTESILSRDQHKITANSANEHLWGNIPIVTVLHPAMLVADGLNASTAKVTNLRGMVSIRGAGATDILTINRYRLTAMPLLCGLTVL